MPTKQLPLALSIPPQTQSASTAQKSLDTGTAAHAVKKNKTNKIMTIVNRIPTTKKDKFKNTLIKTQHMPDERICIIGMGEIGTAIYDEIAAKKQNVFGVDANEERIKELQQKGYAVGKQIPESDVYIIAVYTTDQAINVIKNINAKKPLISVESTINPVRVDDIKKLCDEKQFELVIFPHRFNPHDAEHRVFNLQRVLGADNEMPKERALKFYAQLMKTELITIVPLKIAALSKVLENTHRFTEIAIAQTYKESCDKLGIDFEQLRKAANTKWNINIKEARDGIKGKCLPKDTEILAEFFDNSLLRELIKNNKEYLSKYSSKE